MLSLAERVDAGGDHPFPRREPFGDRNPHGRQRAGRHCPPCNLAAVSPNHPHVALLPGLPRLVGEDGAWRYDEIVLRLHGALWGLGADDGRHAGENLNVLRLIDYHGNGIGARGLRGFAANLCDLADELTPRESVEAAIDFRHAGCKRDQALWHLDGHLDLRDVQQPNDRLLGLDRLEVIHILRRNGGVEWRFEHGIVQLVSRVVRGRPQRLDFGPFGVEIL